MNRFVLVATLFVANSAGAQTDSSDRLDRLQRRAAAPGPVVLQSVSATSANERLRLWYERHGQPHDITALLRRSVWELESFALALEKKAKVNPADLEHAVGRALSLLGGAGFDEYTKYLHGLAHDAESYDLSTLQESAAKLALGYLGSSDVRRWPSLFERYTLQWVNAQSLHSLARQLERTAQRLEADARRALR